MKLVLKNEPDRSLATWYMEKLAEDMTDEDCLKLGKQIREQLAKVEAALKAEEEFDLEHCDCSWKSMPEKDRKTFGCHSSECAIWDADYEENTNVANNTGDRNES